MRFEIKNIIVFILFSFIINLVLNGQSPWTHKADFGGTGRIYAVGFSIGNKGYIGTGFDRFWKRDFWEYDPQTDTWTQKANFRGSGIGESVGFSIGNRGYITDWEDFWEYNPQTNKWTQKADFGGAGRYEAVGFSIGNKGYVGTGRGMDGYLRGDFWEYDSQTDTWTRKSIFGGTVRMNAVGFSIGTKGYIGTGIDYNSQTNDFWEYDSETNTRSQKADFGGTGRMYAVGFSIGNKGYIGTGTGIGKASEDFWEYDPQTNTWTQKSDFGGAGRVAAVGFSIGDKGYIGTGTDGADYLNDFWEYDPSKDIIYPTGPLLSISPSTGKQLEVTFEITGSNFTPNGEVHRFLKHPNEEYQQISTITADNEGEVYWTYTPDCNHPVGDTYIYTVDVSTNQESNEITQNVIENPICKDDGVYAYYFDFPVQPINEWFIYSPGGDFSDYRYLNNIWGYHAGEDWNTYKGNLGQPVYAVANGKVVIKSFTENVGGTLVIEHTARDPHYFVISPSKIEPPHEYEYDKQLVDKIYSVYIHIGIPDHIEVGTDVIKGDVIGSIIQVPGMGPHLHFEIRGPNTINSPSGQMLGDPNNWAGNGDYEDIQKLVNDGAIKPIQFIAANLDPLSSSLQVGDRIRLSQPTNVRPCPSTDNDECPSIKLMPEGSIGTLTNESLRGVPETNNGYIWWEIMYDMGEIGWTAQGNPGTGDMWLDKIQPLSQSTKEPEVGPETMIHFDDTELTLSADINESDLINIQYFNIPPYVGSLPESFTGFISYYWKIISGVELDFSNGKVSVPSQPYYISDDDDITWSWLKRSNINVPWIDIGGTFVEGNFESTVPFDSFSELTIGHKAITHVEDIKRNIPDDYKLYQNYPNPFNPTTVIEYELPKESYVSLSVYSTLGQRVATLFHENQSSGRYKVNFDSKDLPSGVYIYRLQAGEYVESRKMLLLK